MNERERALTLSLSLSLSLSLFLSLNSGRDKEKDFLLLLHDMHLGGLRGAFIAHCLHTPPHLHRCPFTLLSVVTVVLGRRGREFSSKCQMVEIRSK